MILTIQKTLLLSSYGPHAWYVFVFVKGLASIPYSLRTVDLIEKLLLYNRESHWPLHFSLLLVLQDGC